MSPWNWIGSLFSGAKDVTEVFKENEENKGARSHLERLADMDHDGAVLQQFAEEFHQRNKRTWWDSFVDGLNRLPRPLLTIGILSFFILTPMYPEKFLEIAQAYQLMPTGYWALLSIIISFYFGGRMQLKSQDMTVKTNVVQAAKELMALREELRDLKHQRNQSDLELEAELAEKVELYPSSNGHRENGPNRDQPLP